MKGFFSDIYLMQNWFNLSTAVIGDAIYNSYGISNFMHIDFLTEQVPDSTTLFMFRHLLEKHKIGNQIFADVTARLEKAGLIMHGGTIVDANNCCPKFYKGKRRKRVEKMHQTKRATSDISERKSTPE